VNQRIGRSSLVLASGTVVSRILGFVSAVVLARTVGLVGTGADAFALANQLPNSVYVIVAGGVLSSVFVPQIVKAQLNDDGGAAYINRLLTLGMSVVFAVTVLAVAAAPLLVRLYTQHSNDGSGSGFGPGELALATAFAWWCLPQVFFYALYSLVGEVLNAKGLFGPFTWSPVLNNIVAILGMLWFGAQFTGNVAVASDWDSTEIAILAGTATLGVMLQALALYAFLGRAGIRFRPDFRFRGVGLGTATKLAAWTFGMILVTQVAGIVQSNIASLATAYGEPGLAVLRFGWLVFMLPHSVITVSLGTAYFTRMSTQIRDSQWDRLGEDIRESLSRISMFMVISAGVLWLTSAYVAGVFAEQTGSGMASVVALFAIGLVPFGIAFVIQRIFFALEDTRTPFLVQLAQSGIFVLGALWVGTGPVENIADGIALAMSISILFQSIVMAVLLRRRLGFLGGRALALALLRFFGAVIPALGVGLLIRNALPETGGSLLASMGFAALLGAGMGVVYLAVLLVFRDTSARDLLMPLLRRGNKRP
jgi:putative peptidoglycan lipid II flippase